MSDVHLFVGPSAYGLPAAELDPRETWVHPPVQRGDVHRLVSQRPVGVALICDGIFKSRPAVSHAELCEAVDAGWQVIGVSSIGAIRAHELRDQGMVGYGEVFAMFSRDPAFTDDEVCLLHFPEPPYFPITEALVNLRFAMQKVGAEFGITIESGQDLLDELAASWFGHRTEERVRDILRSRVDSARQDVDGFLKWTRANRVKTRDLANLLLEKPWIK